MSKAAGTISPQNWFLNGGDESNLAESGLLVGPVCPIEYSKYTLGQQVITNLTQKGDYLYLQRVYGDGLCYMNAVFGSLVMDSVANPDLFSRIRTRIESLKTAKGVTATEIDDINE